MSLVTTSLLLSRGPGGSPTFQSGGRNQKCPSHGHIGCTNPAIEGSPNASEQRTKSEVAHKWAWRLKHPRCMGAVPNASKRGTKSEVAQKRAC